MKTFREFGFPGSGNRSVKRPWRSANLRLERLEDRLVPSPTGRGAVLPMSPLLKLPIRPTLSSLDKTAGYAITLTNTGNSSASGVTLSDALPAGLGKDIKWTIDTSTGNPS